MCWIPATQLHTSDMQEPVLLLNGLQSSRSKSQYRHDKLGRQPPDSSGAPLVGPDVPSNLTLNTTWMRIANLSANSLGLDSSFRLALRERAHSA